MGRVSGGVTGTKRGSNKVKIGEGKIVELRKTAVARYNYATAEGKSDIVSQINSIARQMTTAQLDGEHLKAMRGSKYYTDALSSAKYPDVLKAYKAEVWAYDALESAFRKELFKREPKKYNAEWYSKRVSTQ